MVSDISDSVLAEFAAVTGAAGLVTAAAQLEPHLTEWRGLYRGSTPVMLSPRTTDEAARLLAICHRHRIGVVPQGGNTGLVGGAVPDSTVARPRILLSSRRLRRIRDLDADNYTITAEAGCILADLQSAAAEADRLFPLSLAAEGSCQLGGNVSTNAGGTNVLRYGNTRDLVLGLEVVLADGRVYDGLRGLRKDNTGYDLKQLFIGAEGTLGFVTAATCKLFPQPRGIATAYVALDSPEAAISLYARARGALGDQLTAFELISRLAADLVTAHIPGVRDPLPGARPWYVLLEIGGADEPEAANRSLEDFLAREIERGRAGDAVVAQNTAQRQDLWRLRHGISEAQKSAGAGIKHDISVPVSSVPKFLDTATRIAAELVPGVHVVAFGHVGDGNLHFNLNQPDDMAADVFLGRWEPVSAAVNGVAIDLGGSFSAEHGIGRLKTTELERWRGGVELELMQAVKHALDPRGIMNPGKVLKIE